MCRGCTHVTTPALSQILIALMFYLLPDAAPGQA
jgi:hypothetical protein